MAVPRLMTERAATVPDATVVTRTWVGAPASEPASDAPAPLLLLLLLLDEELLLPVVVVPLVLLLLLLLLDDELPPAPQVHEPKPVPLALQT
jgi:hypothetical protein